MRLAVLGDPLRLTRSPELHRAGLAALGIECDSHALRTPAILLGERLAELAAAGYRGVNLTYPLKEEALRHLATVSDDARIARSVNTVSFDPAGVRGDTTDGAGFVDLLRALEADPARERVLLLGAGGAARSLALALRRAGALVHASARNPQAAAGGWTEIGIAPVAWRGEAEAKALAAATLIVNATPLVEGEGPLPPGRAPRDARLVDLVYAEGLTPWVAKARALGYQAWDGLGLLVHQARRSLELWTGRPVPVAPLAAAVGWPR
jgi:shikimate dehydrogenase